MTDTVLVVDDEKDLADAYARSLSDQYETYVAYNGEEAIEKITEEIDVVLLDRKMPRISGDDVLKEIRTQVGYQCSVVMVTAVEPDFDVINMDFDGYVVKPVSGDELHNIVQEMIERSQLGEQERKLLSLRNKVKVIKQEKPQEELDKSEEFQNLEKKLNNTREKISFEDIEENIHDALEKL